MSAVAISKTITQAERDLLGGMSRGLAHDLQGLLTPVSTCLQLCAEGAAGRAKAEALLPVALRNLKTVQAYIQQARHFSEHAQPLMRPERLDLLLHLAVSLAEFRWKSKRLAVVASVPGEMTVELDAVFVLRLLGNLLANAIEAAPPDSTVQFELRGGDGEWVHIQITDEGVGIGREKLRRLLAPDGKTKSASGLGLAICRKIVQWHDGRLTMTSQPNAGTTVTVELPKRQPVKPARRDPSGSQTVAAKL